MYIRKASRTYKGKTYSHFLLVESLLTPKGPRQKVICSLGDLSVIANRPELADNVGPQFVEVTPDNKAVSAPREWANLGPATSYSGLGRPQCSGNARGIATLITVFHSYR